MGVETVATTDVGRARDHNEDSVLVAPTSRGRLLAVADGMGGHNAGEVASATALEALVGELGEVPPATDPAGALESAVAAADDAVVSAAAADADREGMGTTLVAALVDGETATVVNVGDSRAYRVDGGDIEQVTTDHSVVQELVEAGEIAPAEAATHPERNVISQALGVSDTVAPDTFSVDLAADDLLLLCSDGLTEEVADDAILSLATGSDSLDAAADALVERANENGGSDNVSVVAGRRR